jgi:hypothetical protein
MDLVLPCLLVAFLRDGAALLVLDGPGPAERTFLLASATGLPAVDGREDVTGEVPAGRDREHAIAFGRPARCRDEPATVCCRTGDTGGRGVTHGTGPVMLCRRAVQDR